MTIKNDNIQEIIDILAQINSLFRMDNRKRLLNLYNNDYYVAVNSLAEFHQLAMREAGRAENDFSSKMRMLLNDEINFTLEALQDDIFVLITYLESHKE